MSLNDNQRTALNKIIAEIPGVRLEHLGEDEEYSPGKGNPLKVWVMIEGRRCLVWITARGKISAEGIRSRLYHGPKAIAKLRRWLLGGPL